MKAQYLILALTLNFVFCTPPQQSRITVVIPSAQAEAEYVWNTLQEIRFFEEYGYQVSLPSGELIEELKEKSRAGSLTDNDYQRLETFLVDHVYNKANYQEGYDLLVKETELIDRMISELNGSAFSWGFKEFENYAINLTLYGPGGSYNPFEGSILLFTTSDGEFKGYKNPANIVIHEIVHIGIESSIITQYNVPHTLKERIVDTFVSLHFKQYLPEYRVQDMGEYRTDPYLKEVDDFTQLDSIVHTILTEN